MYKSSKNALNGLQTLKNEAKKHLDIEGMDEMVDGYTVLQSIVTISNELPKQFNTIKIAIIASVNLVTFNPRTAEKLTTNFLLEALKAKFAGE